MNNLLVMPLFTTTEKTDHEKMRELINLVIENNDAANVLMCGIHSGFLKEDDSVREGFGELMSYLDPVRPREKMMGKGLMESFMDAAVRDYTPKAQQWVAEIVATAQKTHPSLFDDDLKQKAQAFFQQLNVG